MSRDITMIASLARTALTDPAGLPTEEALTNLPPHWGIVPLTGYAVDCLDEIIQLLDPSDWTAERAAAALSALGRCLAEVREGLTGLAEDESSEACVVAANRTDDALADLDEAISTLNPHHVGLQEASDA